MHSLQEMTDADEGQHAPSSVRGSKIHHVFPQTLTKSSVIRDESAPHGYSELQDLIIYTSVISLVSFHGLTLVKANIPSTSSTVWLTKAVDTSVSYPVHVVVYTVPSLRKPPVLLVRQRVMRGGEITDSAPNHFSPSPKRSLRPSSCATLSEMLKYA